MKIIYSIYFIFIFSFLCCAQKTEKVLTVEAYLDALQDYQEDGYSKYMALDEKEFNHLIKEAYEAIEIGSSDILKITKVDVPKRNAQGDLLRAIGFKYPNIIKYLISIPVYIKARIVSSEEVNKGGFRQINLILKPEQIIKGKEPFLNQSEFEVFYREYEYVPDSLDYKIGKSYLFPLWDRGEPENEIFAIATFLDGTNGYRFLVENDVLYDDANYFGMGTKVNWSDFVKNINEIITNIINEKGLEIYKKPLQQGMEK